EGAQDLRQWIGGVLHGVEPACKQQRPDQLVEDSVAEGLLRLEMVKQRSLSGPGRLDDVVEAAALQAIGVELAEGCLQELAARWSLPECWMQRCRALRPVHSRFCDISLGSG